MNEHRSSVDADERSGREIIRQESAVSVSSETETPRFEELYRAEESHFWFQSRACVIGEVFRRLQRHLENGYRVLEVGCGTGKVLSVLEDVCRDGEVIGAELHREGVEFARKRVNCRVVQGNVYRLPFSLPFDLIGMFDVLEHLDDDRGALDCLYSSLKPGGAAVLTVPAHMALWSFRDVAAEHCRRYSPSGLREKLEASGFEVEYLSQFMAPLVPVMWLSRRVSALLARFRSKKAREPMEMAIRELKVVPVLNRLLGWLLRLEAPLVARQRILPVGTSLLAVARKPKLAGELGNQKAA